MDHQNHEFYIHYVSSKVGQTKTSSMKARLTDIVALFVVKKMYQMKPIRTGPSGMIDKRIQ